MKVGKLIAALQEIENSDTEVRAVDDYVRLIEFDRVERYSENGKDFIVLTSFPMTTRTPA